MEIKTKRLLIKELKNKDDKDLVENANDISVSRYLSIVPFPYKKKDAKWFINYCKKESKKNPRINYELGIEFKKELVGIIGLTKTDRFSGTAFIGFWIGKKFWRKGIVSEAAIAMINFAFKKLKLRRIDSEVYSENVPSRNLLKKLGFEEEGFRREKDRVKSTGKVHDVYVFGLLKEDWKKTSAKKSFGITPKNRINTIS